MAGVNRFIKYAMFIFNFVFWLCGILILATAIWIRVSKDKHEVTNSGDTGADSNVSVNILIAVGAIIMILGFLGCWGAIKENRCMLLSFFIGLLLILLLQLASGILGISIKSKSENALNETLHENAQLLSQTDEKGKQFQKGMIEYQEENKCCGLVDGAADWGNNFDQAYESCKCSSPPDACITYDGRLVYKTTCMSSIKDSVSKHLKIIIAISFGLAIIEILGMVFSMVLYCQIKSK